MSCSPRVRLGVLSLSLISALLLAGACSPYMAAKQPGKKDVSLFRVGTPRSMLIAEFGPPTATEMQEETRHDIFAFRQGYSAGARAGRAVFHGAADVVTLGLWEVVGTPTEGVFDGTEMAFEVSYDENNRVKTVVPLKQ
ncbi:MAG: hypothetical protein OXC18_07630 [Desulfurellaceae bacterium]|nr:hypothetical protein [Desulfurellaceae bacterium]